MTSALLRHVWGESRAVDRVWAQVSGLPPSLSDRRLLMVFQACIDDSAAKDGTFVLGGHIATAENWAKFSADWEQLLPLARMNRDGKRRFKMTEMMSNPQRRQDTAAFFRVIEKHVACSISCAFNVDDLRAARGRVYVPDAPINWSKMRNSYFFAFRLLMDTFHAHKEKMSNVIPMDERVDFIFDDQSEKSLVLSAWDGYLASRPADMKPRFGSMPRFENDEEFLPLQAADLWAGAVRGWTAAGTPEKIRSSDFGEWKAEREDRWTMTANMDQDRMVEALMNNITFSVPRGIPVFDRAAKIPMMVGIMS